jgi:4-amino-4-deoxy-L-arabinose transferase-like glycosyltransferase
VSTFGRRLLILLALAFAVRIGYVVVQPRFDPTFSRPILDGAYYVELAHAMASGSAAHGVYYMPPLYPWILAGLLSLFGEAWTLLYSIQQLAVVLAAGAMALVARRAAGRARGTGHGRPRTALSPDAVFCLAAVG